jgi:hypothetical protein
MVNKEVSTGFVLEALGAGQVFMGCHLFYLSTQGVHISLLSSKSVYIPNSEGSITRQY